MRLRRILSIIRKEFIQIKRDRPSLAIAIMMPLMMMFLFGYAVKVEVDHVPTAVWDESQTPKSREFIQAFKNSNYFDIVTYALSRGEMQDLMDRGKVKAALHIPPDFSRNILKGEPVETEMLVDGSDPTVARTVFSSGVIIAENYSRDISIKSLLKKGAGITALPIELKPRVEYNPSFKTEIFTIPGLLGLVMQNITVMLTAFALVRERERGTIEQLIVTPVKHAELIIGKLIPYIFIAFIDFILTLSIGMFWFHVPVKGSLALFIFPLDAMPIVVRWTSYMIPLTYFLRIIRGIAVKGVSFNVLYSDTLALSFFGLVLFVLAILRFRKKLE